MTIKKILVLFKTHLDIGFTDFSETIVQTYFDRFIPEALATAKKLRESGTSARFVWTTGSWLIREYLRTHEGEEKECFVQGILRGDISWHGLPFTTHTELMSGSLFEYGLSIGNDLDRQFSKKTIAAKMTDVPGHTRAIVPYLKHNGIEFLHIGVNPAATVPDVPGIFRWMAPDGSAVNVMYQRDYGEFSVIGNTGTAVYFAHTGDNMGCQSAQTVEALFRTLQAQYPDAQIVAGDLNDLALEVRKIENTLPVITHEIGDTWIHGIGTDPKKVSQFRALERLYDKLEDREDKKALARGLIMIPEHTWGLDVKLHLADHAHYDKASFAKLRNSAENYQKMERSWKEQRDYLSGAIHSMSASGQKLAAACLKEAQREEASVSGMQKYTVGEIIGLGDFQMSFDQTGEMDFLRFENRILADADHRLGSVRYEQFSWADYQRFYGQYIRLDVEWAREDNTKIGMEAVAKQHDSFAPNPVQIFYDSEKAVIQYAFDDAAYTGCGCPKRMELVITPGKNCLHMDIAWFHKPANRIAEAIWFGFSPIASHKRISKLGSYVDPNEVVSKGQSLLHGTDFGVVYKELSIESLDAALVAPQEPSLLNFCDRKSTDSKIYFNLYNNIWGTNFPMWYDENARFRFVIRPADHGKEG